MTPEGLAEIEARAKKRVGSWDVGILDGDIFLLLAHIRAQDERIKALEELWVGCVCQACGQQFYADVVLPDELWNRIRPEGKPEGGGLLCGACIGKRVGGFIEKLEAAALEETDPMVQRRARALNDLYAARPRRGEPE